MNLGIDYASVDGNKIDPSKTGARFAYIRASAGLITDPTWHLERAAWSAANIPAGAYHALAWHTDPVMQAHNFIACAGERRPGEMPFALDIEADSAAALHMTPEQCLAHAEAVLRELADYYGTIVVYTSARVWADVMGGLPSALIGSCPLWLKVPYMWKARSAPHPESAPYDWKTPAPWDITRILQYQGDAIGLPGTTSTIDLNEFVEDDAAADFGVTDIKAFQAAHSLVVDGIIGPRTFAALTAR